jgi:Putative peptidoglycan binding domain
MKKLLLLTLALSLPLAQVMRADNNDDKKKRKKHVAAEAQTGAPAQQHAASARQLAQPQVRRAVVPHQHTAVAPARRQAVKSEASLGAGKVQHATGSQMVTQPNRTVRNFNRNSFAVAKSRVIVVRHDRGWWVNRFPNTRFVLFGGGYYYWDGGYWYPAYGYSPIYSTYAYNEPIYGYNNLAPGQVLQNVQVALRNQGYYRGSIDGLIGPQTRGALASFQQAHGLLVTSAVDEPTLVTLGLA